MKLARSFASLLLVAVSAAGMAQAFNYGRLAVPIRAGTLIIESQRTGSVAANPAPHVWGNLDADLLVKPATWSIVNPRAPSILTQSLYARWAVIDPTGVPAAGSRLTKRTAPYWEVSLANSSDAVLAKYDVLSISLAQNLSLNALERERLRRFVDQGGVLWIDLQPTAFLSVDLGNPAPLPFFLDRAGGGALTADFSHPALSYPNAVTLDELNVLQGGGRDVVREIASGDLGAIEPTLAWLAPDSLRFQSVAGDSKGSTFAVGKLGDGYVAVTTRGISSYLNRGLVSGGIVPNLGYQSTGPVEDGYTAAAAKLVVNMLHLASGFTAPGQGSRKSSSSPVNLSAPLLRRWTGSLAGGTFSGNRPPVLFKGRVVVVSSGKLSVIDARPDADLDNDGNPDDGIQDPLDASMDVVWEGGALGSLSAPACVEVPDTLVTNPARGNAPVRYMVLVTDANGRVLVYDLESPGSSGVAPVKIISPPDASTPSTDGPYPPTVHEGIGFVADLRATDDLGRAWAFDVAAAQALNTAGPWAIFGSPRMREPSSSPTVGYIPILDNSGGVDRVLYIPTKPTSPSRPAGLASIWFGSRGEKPVSVVNEGTQLRITTRASLQGLPVFLSGGGSSTLGVKFTVLDNNGNPKTFAQLQTIFTGSVMPGGSNGEILAGLAAGGQALDWDGLNTPNNPNDDVSLRVDYTVDWGATASGSFQTPPDSYIRGNLELPDEPAVQRQVLGNIAMGQNGNIFVVTADPAAPTAKGTLFALREDGRGDFKLLYRWDLYDQLTFRLNNSSGTGNEITMPPAITDEDSLVKDFLKFLDSPIKNLTFRSGPTVKGDLVYVMASGVKNFFNAATTVLLAFNADPQPLQFDLQNTAAGFAIIQPDIARSTVKNAPDAYSVLQAGQFSYEQDPATGTGRVRMPNAMAVSRGRVRDALSTSLPLIIRRAGQPDVVVEPEAGQTSGAFVPGFANGKWNPLRWYTVINGYNSFSSPIVLGDTLYFAGASYLPSLLINQFPPIPKGMLYGMDADIAANDVFLKSNTVRPWQLQLNQLIVQNPGPPPFRIPPSMRWPQIYGIQSFDDFRVRLLQNALEETTALALVGGDGALVATSQTKMYGYTRADFTVADEGRAGRYDSNGNPIWTTDMTQTAGTKVPVGSVSSAKPISRPQKVYAQGENTYWLVDSGANRVVRLDSAGRELRSIADLKIDPKFQPAGTLDNETRKLSSPRDLFVYETRVPAASNPFTNAQPLEQWVNYVIADTGNFRLVQLVDRYALDPQTGRSLGIVTYVDPTSTRPGKLERAMGVLFWHSPSELTGRQYAYNSISRVFVPGQNGARVPIFAFGFGNNEPGKSSLGLDTGNQSLDSSSGYGGVVLFDGANTQLITSVNLPAIPANIFWDEPSQSFKSPARPAEEHKLSGLSSATLRYVTTQTGPQLAVMIADNSGVYEAVLGAPNRWDVRWYLPNDAYKVIRRRFSDNKPTGVNALELRSMYARRLDSGEVLLVNGYYGRTRSGGSFTGEVVLLDGGFGGTGKDPGFDWNRVNLGFNSLSVKFELPPISGARTIISPVFAQRK